MQTAAQLSKDQADANLRLEGNRGTEKSADLANALCNLLLDHALSCDTCLDGFLDDSVVKCFTYLDLQNQISHYGGATKPLVFAY